MAKALCKGDGVVLVTEPLSGLDIKIGFGWAHRGRFLEAKIGGREARGKKRVARCKRGDRIGRSNFKLADVGDCGKSVGGLWVWCRYGDKLGERLGVVI